MLAEKAQPTYTTIRVAAEGEGGAEGPRLPATACDARGEALWPAALRISLLLDAGLPEAEQARHSLATLRLQPLFTRAAAPSALGCSPSRVGLQPLMRGFGCMPPHHSRSRRATRSLSAPSAPSEVG